MAKYITFGDSAIDIGDNDLGGVVPKVNLAINLLITLQRALHAELDLVRTRFQVERRQLLRCRSQSFDLDSLLLLLFLRFNLLRYGSSTVCGCDAVFKRLGEAYDIGVQEVVVEAGTDRIR